MNSAGFLLNWIIFLMPRKLRTSSASCEIQKKKACNQVPSRRGYYLESDSFRKKPSDSMLGHLKCLSLYKISYHTFICFSHSQLQLLLLMHSPDPLAYSIILLNGILQSAAAQEHQSSLWQRQCFIETDVVSTWGERFGLCGSTDIPQRVIQRYYYQYCRSESNTLRVLQME